ncbi:MAG: PHP domain-containing protein [Clostridiales bacterium]|nr:PHP domain-containing protein [Clostridiales bacterium]
MKLYYDFHIHSGLSPCGSEDMSPNNIVNMSIIKGLDVIAITDHNGIANARVMVEVGKNSGLIVIPGIEIQTIEDVHIVALFKRIEQLEQFYDEIKEQRLLIKNKPERFGEQMIFNHEDEVIGYEDNYLITPFNITIDKMIEFAKLYEGIVFPAHINRNSFSIIKSLGFIDESLDIKNIEWYGKRPEDADSYDNRMFKKYRELVNSDAHELINISERENYLEVSEKTVEAIFDTLAKEI